VVEPVETSWRTGCDTTACGHRVCPQATPSRTLVRSSLTHGPLMPWTYILECSDGTYYVGSTIDLERRFHQHQLGEGAAYTRSRLPVRLVWSGWFDSIRDAFYFEKQVQGWGRAKRLALIEGRWADLPALARTAKPDAASEGLDRLDHPPDG
jgi:putative endonuclease